MLVHCAHARYVWNLALEQRNYWREWLWVNPTNETVRGSFTKADRARHTLSGYDQNKELAPARNQSPWLKSGSSAVQQQAVLDLDRAFKNWWGNPGHFGRPRWRKAGVHEGFAVRDNKVRRLSRKWGEILVPKCGWVRFRVTRSFQDIERAKSARVTLDRQGRWHVSFTLGQPEVVKEQTGAVVGVDLGVAHTVTTSDSDHSSPGRLQPHEVKRLRRLQRKMARQQKNSKRREQTRLAIARLKATEAARRKDWIEKTTTQLVRDNDIIAIENLRVKNMMRSAAGTITQPGTNVAAKAGLNRSIAQQGWGMFRLRLEQKAQAATTETIVVAVNPVNTSRRCSACGYTTKKNRKNQADFLCQSCGYTANADVNAAINIKQLGLAELTTAGHCGDSAAPSSGTTQTSVVRAKQAQPNPAARPNRGPVKPSMAAKCEPGHRDDRTSRCQTSRLAACGSPVRKGGEDVT